MYLSSPHQNQFLKLTPSAMHFCSSMARIDVSPDLLPILTPGIIDAINSCYIGVNHNESSLEEVSKRCRWHAEYVATIFVFQREGICRSGRTWQHSSHRERIDALEEELEREEPDQEEPK